MTEESRHRRQIAAQYASSDFAQADHIVSLVNAKEDEGDTRA